MKILRLYGRLLVVVFFLVSAIRSLGTVQPSPGNALFAEPDGSACGMPCLFGVRPDSMTVDQALSVLAAHPLTRQMRIQKDAATPNIDIGSATGREVLITIFSSDPDVNKIKYVRFVSI